MSDNNPHISVKEDFQILGELLLPFWTFVHENQSLTAGLFAICAAFIAARPVWKQLDALQKQIKLQSRSLADINQKQLQSICDDIQSRSDAISNNINYALYGHGFGDEAEASELDVHTAHDLELTCRSFGNRLNDLLEQVLIPQEIEADVKNLIRAASKLENTLYDIHAPASVEFDDPFIGIKDPQVAREKAFDDAKRAHENIEMELASLLNCTRILIEKLKGRVRELRLNLRELDDQI